jgi:NADH:ubiquinone oxidoreductase subunit 2 (subunit N)
LVIKILISHKIIFVILIMVFSSLISLYFYCRVIYSSLIINNPINILTKKTFKIQPVWYTVITTFNILIPVTMLV